MAKVDKTVTFSKSDLRALSDVHLTLGMESRLSPLGEDVLLDGGTRQRIGEIEDIWGAPDEVVFTPLNLADGPKQTIKGVIG